MKIRSHFDDVDRLIAHVKASVTKNKQRKAMFVGIGLPPQPVVTRWASWLEAAFYYADNFPEVKAIIENFEDDGILVDRAKQSVAKQGLPHQLMIIRRDYKVIADCVKQLEANSFTIKQAHEMVDVLDFGPDE